MKKRPSILLSECNSPKMMLKSIYGRGRSLDRAECGFRSKSFEEESRRFLNFQLFQNDFIYFWSSFLKRYFLFYLPIMMGPGRNFWPWLGRVNFLMLGSGQPLVWVGIWKISPKNCKFFNFFPLDQKNLFGSDQRLVGLLFTAGQKYARVRSGSSSTYLWLNLKYRY